MYAKITSSGGRRYLQLVEGYRTDNGKVRQRTIGTVGRIEDLQDGALVLAQIALLLGDGDVIAIDGKALRGVRDKGQNPTEGRIQRLWVDHPEHRGEGVV